MWIFLLFSLVGAKSLNEVYNLRHTKKCSCGRWGEWHGHSQ